jgi:hypothetical protein
MANHLRVILKSILLQKGTEYQIGDYHAIAEKTSESLIIKIYHVKYLGFRQFESCIWNVSEKEVTIPNGDVCREGEVIYILRSIQSIHQEVEKVYAIYQHDSKGAKKDVTAEYEHYL